MKPVAAFGTAIGEARIYTIHMNPCVCVCTPTTVHVFACLCVCVYLDIHTFCGTVFSRYFKLPVAA